MSPRPDQDDRLISAPNLLTLSRIPLAGALWAARGHPLALCAIMALAALTDVLDGWLARRLRARGARFNLPPEQAVGVWLDPICDKIFILSLLLLVYVARRPSLGVMALICARDLVMVPLLAVYRLVPGLRHRLRLDLRAGPAGKATTVAQFLTTFAIVAGLRITVPLAAATAAIGLLAVAFYLDRAVRAWSRFL